MRYDSEIHHRRSIRLKGYDYSRNGAYFFTICTADQQAPLLGQVQGEAVDLSPAGKVVQSVWAGLVERFSSLIPDEFIIMPDHIHGIVFIDGGCNEIGRNELRPVGVAHNELVGARFIAPLVAHPNRPALGEIIRVFKAISTRLIRRDLMTEFAWQRNYYERIIHNEEELNRARRYVVENPVRWAK